MSFAPLEAGMTQLERARAFMADGHWHRLADLAAALKATEAAASARLRDLRKPEHGGYEIVRRGPRHAFEYHLSGGGAPVSRSREKTGTRRAFTVAVTWEHETDAPRTWRGELVSSTTIKAITKALSEARPLRHPQWRNVVVLLERVG